VNLLQTIKNQLFYNKSKSVGIWGNRASIRWGGLKKGQLSDPGFKEPEVCQTPGEVMKATLRGKKTPHANTHRKVWGDLGGFCGARARVPTWEKAVRLAPENMHGNQKALHWEKKVREDKQKTSVRGEMWGEKKEKNPSGEDVIHWGGCF